MQPASLTGARNLGGEADGCSGYRTEAPAAWWRDKIETNRGRDSDTYRGSLKPGGAVVRLREHELPERALNGWLREGG
jgi:hypothetical protein